MDRLIEVGLQVVIWFQWLGDWLAVPMRIFSFLGEEMFFLILVPIIYWAVDATLGIRMGIMLLTSQGLASFLKLAFHTPRPYWVNLDINARLSETSFGLPSGHAFTATSVWGALAHFFKKVWVWVAAVILILLVAISRLYNGVHFPQDVIAGFFFGALLLAIYLMLEQPAKRWIVQQNRFTQILAAFGFSLVLILLVVVTKFALSGWVIPDEWVRKANFFFPDAGKLDPLAIAGVFSSAGTLFGLFLGLILNPLWGGFYAGGEGWMKFMRVLFGLSGLLLIYYGLRAIPLTGEIWYAYIFRYFRYGVVGFWVTGGAPWLFRVLGFVDEREEEKTRKKVRKAKKSYAG